MPDTTSARWSSAHPAESPQVNTSKDFSGVIDVHFEFLQGAIFLGDILIRRYIISLHREVRKRANLGKTRGTGCVFHNPNHTLFEKNLTLRLWKIYPYLRLEAKPYFTPL